MIALMLWLFMVLKKRVIVVIFINIKDVLNIGDPHIYSNKEQQFQAVGTYTVRLDSGGR